MSIVRAAIAQINTIVGDLACNTEKVLLCIKEAENNGADLVIFPELTVTGYPPEDLLLKQDFIKQNIRCLNKIASQVKDIIAIVGFVDKDPFGIYNSAAILAGKKVMGTYRKKHLPNYGVFDEKRYFTPGRKNIVVKAVDFSFVVNICEDIWNVDGHEDEASFNAADFLINISASPYHMGKAMERKKVILDKVIRFKIPVLYCNLVGGQDELVFDGRSIAFDGQKKLLAKAKGFEEDLLFFDFNINKKKKLSKKIKAVTNIYYEARQDKRALPYREPVKDMKEIEEVYSALVLGLRDYVRKNNFTKAALGLSGGVDSALVACIAVDALGKANVLCASMPSKYSSEVTKLDAEIIAKNLGIKLVNIAIEGVFRAYLDIFDSHFKGMETDVTEENIQARIRGNILMAFSNKFGYLVLTTGNKSETSVGYCTLYGDMAGGFAVIKDVPKRMVYDLAGYVNQLKGMEVIPDSVFKRPPSAELRPNQKDQDSLPPYDFLDKIIGLYIEKDKDMDYIINKAGNSGIVKKIIRMIDNSEYKRRQAPPGIKITPKAFGKDRRMPITNRFTP